jgi:hypothetical protein
MRRPVGVNPFLCSWDKIHLLAGLNAIAWTPSCAFVATLPSALWCKEIQVGKLHYLLGQSRWVTTNVRFNRQTSLL